MNNHTILFFPRIFFNASPSYLIGFIQNKGNCYHVNCVAIVSISPPPDLNNLMSQMMGPTGDSLNTLCLIGMFCDIEMEDDILEYETFMDLGANKLSFVLFKTNNYLEVNKMWLDGNLVNPSENLIIVLYDSEQMIASQASLEKDPNTFTSFLYLTCTESYKIRQIIKPIKCNCVNSTDKNIFREDDSLKNATGSPPLFAKCNYIFDYFLDIMDKLALGGQLKSRAVEVRSVCSELGKNGLSVQSKSVLMSILLDVVLGIVVIGYYGQPQVILDWGLWGIGQVVAWLKALLYWLMGVPAGLKLNRQLNGALGYFFLYHIHLWETYVAIIRPGVELAVRAWPCLGALGLSFLLGGLSDLVSLATVHVYCFYGYAARLYAFEMQGLAALWRLFRGRKWNVLRGRVDSYHYRHNQLMLGTFLLTILLFLLPTVLLYYAVFSALRLGVLALRGIVQVAMSLISSSAPFHALLLPPSEPHLSILASSPNLPLIMDLTLLSAPSSTLIATLRLPSFNWKTLLTNLLWGNLL